jgi:ubiquitin carboxyl-terminal hydrolase 9/13
MPLSSGPHHGHYVSIIKAGGLWKLFDDDHVETIKESDIPKYFGDSNCGSAYVLYYQAVNINLPSLGLRPPTPQPTANPVPVPVSVALDDSQAPTLPPGLTTEHDSSDLAESSGPTTPAPSNPTDSPKINSSPTHSKPSLPSHELPPPPPIPQQPPQKPHGGLFHSLRHVPSVKIKRHSGEKLEAVSVSTNSSASGSASSPANLSSSQLLNRFELIPPIPGSPSVEPTSPKSNEVGKDRWYRRKGTKSKEKEKEKGSTPLLRAPLFDRRPTTAPGKRSESLAPPSPASTVDSSSQRSSSPSHPQSESEAKVEKPPVSPNLTRKSSAPVPRHSPSNSRSTPSFADDIPAVPPLPPLSSSSTVQVHRIPRPQPQSHWLPFDLPQRRATVVGDGTTGQKTGLNGHAKLNGDVAVHYSKPRPSSLHADMLPTASSSSSELLTPTPGRPSEANNLPLNADSLRSATTTAVTATGQEGSGAQSNWKRATRKLSLTSAVLGFAKREKHKDKLGVVPQDPV